MDDESSINSTPNPAINPLVSQEHVHLSPGANGILDVTPVNSFAAADDEPSPPSGHPERRNEEAFSSSSDGSDNNISDEGGSSRRSGGNESPVTSAPPIPNSLDDNDDNNQETEHGQTRERQSEWDKALRKGKPNTGHASKFFTEQKGDEDDFLSRADSNLLQEVSTAPSLDEKAVSTDTTTMKPAVAATKPAPSNSVTPVAASSSSITNYRPVGGNNKYLPGPTSVVSNSSGAPAAAASFAVMRPHPTDNLSAGVLPDVLIAMRQRIESLTLFDSDMMRLAATSDDDPMLQESIESLKRSFHQSISAAVLVSLSHKRYERRRLAAMEIEKVVRSLLHQGEVERVRAILLLLSDDYVRSTSEDAQSLFNVVKIMPVLAIQHFFILFEILRSLYADVDVDVRSGAELLDKKLKDVIVHAINSGTFTVEACVPVFARFVYIRNKATKRLTLTWLQELSEKLVGAPILEFLHLFLSGIFDMIGDPTAAIRLSALAFLQSVLPKILVLNTDTPLEENRMAVDFDKILQSLVTTMEHPDPFVRKVSMYWMSRIVKAHIGEDTTDQRSKIQDPEGSSSDVQEKSSVASAAAVSVRNSLPHVLPGVLLSIGDSYDGKVTGLGSNKDSFLPDQTTRSLAEQTNSCLQASVRRDGEAYVQHLDGFINALREELDSPGGMNSRHSTAVERTPYRMDVKLDGSGIERPGWFRESEDEGNPPVDDSLIMSRLCALHWIIVLYESVVPDLLKADYAKEFIYAIIHQFVHNPPKEIIEKSLEVLAKITKIVPGEEVDRISSQMAMTKLGNPAWASNGSGSEDVAPAIMNESSIDYALLILGADRKKQTCRDREVFWALIQLHSYNENLLQDLTGVITYMCKLQPSEFVMVSFAVELDRFIRKKSTPSKNENQSLNVVSHEEVPQKDLKFVSSFVQHMSHVLLNAEEAIDVRKSLKDCVGSKGSSERDRQMSR
eukprot:scaffold1936_cov154-Amphora_coffeaeformis.AAC.1